MLNYRSLLGTGRGRKLKEDTTGKTVKTPTNKRTADDARDLEKDNGGRGLLLGYSVTVIVVELQNIYFNL